jgi:hypothetical protein
MDCKAVPCSIEDGPFIFISYAHDDADIVATVIEGIASGGYNVWYDQGIGVSTIWSDEIANAITVCKVFVVFATRAAMESSYVRSEVEFALDKKVKVIPVYLEGMSVLPPGLALMLHSTQGVEGRDPQIIIFKIRQWLVQNWNKDGKQRSSASGSDQSLQKRETKESEEDSYWNYGLNGNKEDYERYLQIKKKLGDETAQAPRRSGHKIGIPTFSFSFLKWPVRLIVFICVTEILRAYLTLGFEGSFFTKALPYWGGSAAVVVWYFTQRYSGQYSLFSLLPLARAIQGASYWVFLLGWLLMTFNFDNFKAWNTWIAQLLAWVNIRYVTSSNDISAPNWLQTLNQLRSAGFYATLAGGGILVVDMVVAFLRSKILGR